LVLILCIVIGIAISSCANTKRSNLCLIGSLALEKSDFPKGTKQDEITFGVSDEPIRSIALYLYYSNTLIWQEVVDYSNDHSAHEEYEYFYSIAYLENNYFGPWNDVVSSDLALNADEYRAACGRQGKIVDCRFLARYGSYTVYMFNNNVSSVGITESDFISAIMAIDHKMNQCLEFEK
jgi:hypothetical protein